VIAQRIILCAQELGRSTSEQHVVAKAGEREVMNQMQTMTDFGKFLDESM
jgi:hypothetical protein